MEENVVGKKQEVEKRKQRAQKDKNTKRPGSMGDRSTTTKRETKGRDKTKQKEDTKDGR